MTIQKVLNLQRISTEEASEIKSEYGSTFNSLSINSGEYVYYKSNEHIELEDLYTKLEKIKSEQVSNSIFFSTSKSLPKRMLNKAGFKFTSKIDNADTILIVPQFRFPVTCTHFMQNFVYLLFSDLDIAWEAKRAKRIPGCKESVYFQIPVVAAEVIENYRILNLKSAIFYAYDQLEPAKDFSIIKQLLDSNTESNFKLANKLLITQNYTYCLDQIVNYQKALIAKTNNETGQNSFYLKELLKIWTNTLELRESQMLKSDNFAGTINLIVAAYGDRYKILYDGFMNRINEELQNNYFTELIFTSKTTYA